MYDPMVERPENSAKFPQPYSPIEATHLLQLWLRHSHVMIVMIDNDNITIIGIRD